MIIKELFEIHGRQGIKTFSDEGFYIVDNNGILYSIACDSINYQREYTETDIKIEE